MGLAAAAVLGLGSSAYLLCRQYLPTVRFDYSQQQQSDPANTNHLLAPSSVPLPAATAAPSSFPSAPAAQSSSLSASQLPFPSSGLGVLPSTFQSSPSSSSFPSASTASALTSAIAASGSAVADRLGLRSSGLGLDATDARTEELLLRGVGDVRSELSDIAAQLKEQAQDNRRILTALQQTLDSLSRERREEQAASRAAAAAAHSRESQQGHSKRGWDTPSTPRNSGQTTASSPASTSHPFLSNGDRDRETREPPMSGGRLRAPQAIDTASSDAVTGGRWSVANGRDSPRSAKSAASSASSSATSHSPLPPLPPLAAPHSPTAAHASTATPTVPSSPSAQNGSSHAASVDARVHSIRAALDELRAGNAVSSALSALSSLSMYVGNVSPLHDKCRKVQLGNANFQQRIARVQAAQDVLLACGFRLKGKTLEWTPSDDKEADGKVLADAREAMSRMQADIAAAQQRRSSEHDEDNGAASASAPLASPLPASVVGSDAPNSDERA